MVIIATGGLHGAIIGRCLFGFELNFSLGNKFEDFDDLGVSVVHLLGPGENLHAGHGTDRGVLADSKFLLDPPPLGLQHKEGHESP